jgi:mono/diheme cytochrome c family protein
VFAPRTASLLALAATVALAVGCGSEGVSVPEDQTADRAGADLFAERCSGCHTLTPAGTEGSGTDIAYLSRNTGPNLDQRAETMDSVLYAIRNGGFSGAIMPQNIVVGADAIEVARFVAKYAGSQRKLPPQPNPRLGGEEQPGPSEQSGPTAEQEPAGPGGVTGPQQQSDTPEPAQEAAENPGQAPGSGDVNP